MMTFETGKAVARAAQVLAVGPEAIRNITMLDKGMTNHSFMFDCGEKRYIMRVPGEGTDALIDRYKEAASYAAIRGLGLCDDLIHIDPASGYKITEFISGARVCDAENEADLSLCMDKLRAFHAMDLAVDHEFDIFGQIDFYESLRGGTPSLYGDYAETKKNVFSLGPFIRAHAGKKCLTHIDAVPDNFLFAPDGAGGWSVQLIDWEYAGMQDPHVDIAMFCVYAGYDRAAIDRLIDIYFQGGCADAVRAKIYCYIAACGLLWSNWCEYKRSLGVDFGDYALGQYAYARDYYDIARRYMAEREV